MTFTEFMDRAAQAFEVFAVAVKSKARGVEKRVPADCTVQDESVDGGPTR